MISFKNTGENGTLESKNGRKTGGMEMQINSTFASLLCTSLSKSFSKKRPIKVLYNHPIHCLNYQHFTH